MTSARTAGLKALLSRLERLGGELRAASGRAVRLPEFDRWCAAYNGLAAEARNCAGASLPRRTTTPDDLLFSGTGVRATAVEELEGLVRAAEDAVHAALAEGERPGMRCIRAGGRPCQMHPEINPRRFAVFFALPFKDPPTCIPVCDALADWLERKRGIPPERTFRADLWVSAGDFVCKICKALQESELVVADLTKKNANVYFELGMAIGMQKPVILLRDIRDAEPAVGSDLLALEYVEYDGKTPTDPKWLERFAVVFDGLCNDRSH